jgi:chitinase
MEPKDIPLGYYTHINFAFALVDPKTFHVAPMDAGTAEYYSAVTSLKQRQRGLEVWIAIGGWAMNDPGPYRTVFSDMARSVAAQDAFFESLITFMFQHDFDGVDLDWEVSTLDLDVYSPDNLGPQYPVADDRGGIPEDFENYVAMLARLRARLNNAGRRFGLSLTLVGCLPNCRLLPAAERCPDCPG